MTTDYEIEPPVDNELDAAARKYSNWGRWGEENELGTVNFITPDVIAGAGALIRSGRVFSLAISVGATGPGMRCPTPSRDGGARNEGSGDAGIVGRAVATQPSR